jgi:hypothetical protein
VEENESEAEASEEESPKVICWNYPSVTYGDMDFKLKNHLKISFENFCFFKSAKKRKRGKNTTGNKTNKTPTTPSQHSSLASPRTPSNIFSPSLTNKLANSVGKAVSTLSKFQAVSSPATEKCNMNDVTVYTHEKLEWLTEQKIRFLMN